MHDLVDPDHAVVDEAEAARLRPVAPDLDPQVPGVLRLDHLAAHRGWSLLAPTEPRPVGPVDVVEPRDVRLEAALCPVFLAEHLRDQLLPPIAPLGHRRVGVRLLERQGVRALLEIRVVGAGRGREEVAPGAGPIGGLDHVRVDEDAAQALHAEVLDEPHAAHVGGEVVDLDGTLGRADGVGLVAQVHREALDTRHALVPLGQGLSIDGPDPGVAKVVEVARERAGDEPARPGDDDQVVTLEPTLDVGAEHMAVDFAGHFCITFQPG